MKKYIKDFEWEFLQEKIKIDQKKDKIIPSEEIPKNITRLEVYRDGSYKIKAKLIATEDKQFESKFLRDEVAGKRINPFTVKGTRWFGVEEFELSDCYNNYIEIRTNEINKSLLDVVLTLSVDEFKTKNKSNVKPSSLVDWYVNGPDINFTRYTKRKMTLNYEKTKSSLDGLDIKFDYGSSNSDISCDFAYINTEDIKFFIFNVSKDFGPVWSKNIGIEYLTELGPIPDYEKRMAISEIVSFVFGKRLFHVGHTLYGIKGEILEQSSISPIVDNLLSHCKNPDVRPVRIVTKIVPPSFVSRQNENKEQMRINQNGTGIEEILTKLVPEYFRFRDKLNLKESLYRYWISMDTPVGTNLPILSSALETLMTGWFKSNKSKSHAFLIPKEEFDKLLREDFEDIEKKLDTFIENKIECLEFEERELIKEKEDIELKKPIMDKIRNSHQMSVNRSFTTFFEELGLKTGKVEREAIEARNPMAHGNLGFKELEKFVIITDAYQTLFNRVLLKILNYEDCYIDRSTLNYPERRIEEPLGGLEQL